MAVRQLRLVVEVEDFDQAVRFYRDVLGLREEAAFSNGPGAHGIVLDAGRATLELFDAGQKAAVDDLEVGRQVAPRIRVAFEVDDGPGATRRLVAAGAREVAPPTVTPWNSVNARLDTPDGLHVTLFEDRT
jgi:catechol 2,3-dioxygenase-like lactoylglutathione lyase family enzyme